MRIALIVSVFMGFSSGIATAQGAPNAPAFIDYSKTWTDATNATIVTDLRTDLSDSIALIGDWSNKFDIAIACFNQGDPNSIVEFIADQVDSKPDTFEGPNN